MKNNLFEIISFLLTAFSAFYFDWQANEVCWGLWVSSLLTGWVVILSSVLRILLHLFGVPILRLNDLDENGDPLTSFFRNRTFSKKLKEGRNPFANLPTIFIVMGSIGIGAFTWFHFTFFHTIQAMLMSFFLQMEPLSLFGPNGFINADKGVVLTYLIENYWPMILGTLMVRRGIIFGGNPGINLKTIYGGVMRIHFFILLSAFLFFLIYFGIEFYQRFLLLILLFLFFFPIKVFRSLILLGLIMTFALNGCDVMWNLGNRGALTRDIRELLKMHGVTIKDPHCNMIGTSRSAICELKLTPEQVALVVKGLNLKELTLESSSGENPWVKIPEPKKGCLSSKFFQGTKQVKAYLSEGRPPQLRLKSGSAFEYFILFQDLETNTICIRVSYAYG